VANRDDVNKEEAKKLLKETGPKHQNRPFPIPAKT